MLWSKSNRNEFYVHSVSSVGGDRPARKHRTASVPAVANGARFFPIVANNVPWSRWWSGSISCE